MLKLVLWERDTRISIWILATIFSLEKTINTEVWWGGEHETL